TNYDTVIEIYSGACPCGLVSLACSDDACGLASQATATLVQNQVYLVRVGGYQTNTGTFDLNIQIGTNTGSVTNLGGQCNGAAHTGVVLASSGSTNIAASITLTLSGVSGLPVIGLGFTALGAPFFCCTIGHNFGAALL